MPEKYFAHVAADPFAGAFERQPKQMPDLAAMMRKPPEWTGGPFEEFAPQAFMARPDAPLALYVHVPFCHHRCTFCPFYINQIRGDFSGPYARELIREIVMTADILKEVIGLRKVSTIYFGGGTPSDLAADDMAAVLGCLFDHFNVAKDAEVTVEGRTTGFTAEKAAAWVRAGANRFSLGVQAADTALRQRIGRISTREEVKASINGIASSGALTVIDMLFGLPGQTADILCEDLRFVCEETAIAGMDLYELKCFPGSPMEKAIANGKMPPVGTFAEKAAMFKAAHERLTLSGFAQFSPKHWRRDARERSLYNRLAGRQVDMIPFGSAGGGRLADIGLGMARDMATYSSMLDAGKKPVVRISASPLRSESGFSHELERAIEGMRLPSIAHFDRKRQADAAILYTQWKTAGLLDELENASGPHLTAPGYFWLEHIRRHLTEFAREGATGAAK